MQSPERDDFTDHVTPSQRSSRLSGDHGEAHSLRSRAAINGLRSDDLSDRLSRTHISNAAASPDTRTEPVDEAQAAHRQERPRPASYQEPARASDRDRHTETHRREQRHVEGHHREDRQFRDEAHLKRAPSERSHARHDDRRDARADELSRKRSGKRRPELCDTCTALNISRDSFVISRGITATADTRTPAINRLRSGKGTQDLPNLNVIRSRIDWCGMCRLLTQAIDAYGSTAEDDREVSCSVCWEVDGHDEQHYSEGSARHFRDSFKKRTRRLRLVWKTEPGKSKEAFIVIVARASKDANQVAIRSAERMFQAREIKDEGRQTMIKAWLDGCHSSHGRICRTKITQLREFRDVVQEPFFGVIDVVSLQLVKLPIDENGEPAQYVALSYVWGNPHQETATVRENINKRRQPGGLESSMRDFPKAIRDTISLVQRLGFRYLWVDALCIVQNNATSFKLNAEIMHTIYGNAHFTICAADGKNATAGLVALDDQAQGKKTAQVIVEVIPDLYLQAVRPPEVVIQDSIWNTRGWTFQERILSRKCVVFAEGKVFYQCRKAALSEEIHSDITGSEWSLQSIGSPMHYLPEIERRAASFYMTAVELFSKRDLTQAGDILAAFRGVESVLEKVLCAPFVFGIPSSHFDMGLLWQPLTAIRRREGRPHVHTSRCKPQADGTYTCRPVDDSTKGQEFPSWSWAGWMGGGIGYDRNMLSGVKSNVEQWLRMRTWVRWRICNGKGRLRPLWNRHYAEDDMSLDDTWKGYTGRPHDEIAYETRPPQLTSIGSASSESESDEAFDDRARHGVKKDADGRKKSKSSAGYDFLSRERQMNFYSKSRERTQSDTMPATSGYYGDDDYDFYREHRPAEPFATTVRSESRRRSYAMPEEQGRAVPQPTAAGAYRNGYPLSTVYEEHDMRNKRHQDTMYNERSGAPSLRRSRSVPRQNSYDSYGGHEYPAFDANLPAQNLFPEGGFYAEPVSMTTNGQPQVQADYTQPAVYLDPSSGVASQTHRPILSGARPIPSYQYNPQPTYIYPPPSPKPELSYNGTMPQQAPTSGVRFARHAQYFPPNGYPPPGPPPDPRKDSFYRDDAYHQSPRILRRRSVSRSRQDTLPRPYYAEIEERSEYLSDWDDDLDDWGRIQKDRYSGHQLATIDTFVEPHFEHPYGILAAPFESWPERSQHYVDLPILRFWTFKTTLQVLTPDGGSATGVSHCHISDATGDWCGFVVVNESWALNRKNEEAEFIAISEAQAFTQEEHPEWTYYSPRQRADSEWEVYYALLVERNAEKQVFERVGLAKVFKDAFNDAPWQEVLLG